MSVRSGPPPIRRSIRGRIERAVLGAAMAIAAFVIERRFVKAIKESGQALPNPDERGLDELLNEGIRISD
jgi:hypothetical protein